MRNTLELFKEFVSDNSNDNLITNDLITEFIKQQLNVESKKLNCTIEFEDKQEISEFLKWSKDRIYISDWSILTDTSSMYENDSAFRSIAKSLKGNKRTYNKYINDNNDKHN